MLTSVSGSIKVSVGMQRGDNEVWPLHEEGSLRIRPNSVLITVAITPRGNHAEFVPSSATITGGDRILSDGSVSSVPARRQGGYWYRAYNTEGQKFIRDMQFQAVKEAAAWWSKSRQASE